MLPNPLLSAPLQFKNEMHGPFDQSRMVLWHRTIGGTRMSSTSAFQRPMNITKEMSPFFAECEHAVTASNGDWFPLIGALVNNRYMITEYMGSGSFAHAWKAFDSLTEKYVVLKVFRGEHDLQRGANAEKEGRKELLRVRKLIEESDVLPEALRAGLVKVIDVTLEDAPAEIVRKDGVRSYVHYSCYEYCQHRDLAQFRPEELSHSSIKYIIYNVRTIVLRWLHCCRRDVLTFTR